MTLTSKDDVSCHCFNTLQSKNFVIIFSYLLRVVFFVKTIMSHSTSSKNRLSCKLIYLLLTFTKYIHSHVSASIFEYSPFFRWIRARVLINFDLFQLLLNKLVRILHNKPLHYTQIHSQYTTAYSTCWPQNIVDSTFNARSATELRSYIQNIGDIIFILI
jgi:hypothetical protein